MALPILAAAGPIAAGAGMGGASAGGGLLASMGAWGPALGGLLGGGLSGIGSAISGAGGQASARAQMAFQERMYRHRYRYTMQDLRKAGLNPILAGEVGGGSAPSGAGYTIPNPLESMGNSAKSALFDMANYSLITSQARESAARARAADASARDVTASAVIKEAAGPRAKVREKVEGDLWKSVGDFWDRLKGMQIFKGATRNSAKDPSQPSFGNVESGSSQYPPRKSFLEEFREGDWRPLRDEPGYPWR